MSSSDNTAALCCVIRITLLSYGHRWREGAGKWAWLALEVFLVTLYFGFSPLKCIKCFHVYYPLRLLGFHLGQVLISVAQMGGWASMPLRHLTPTSCTFTFYLPASGEANSWITSLNSGESALDQEAKLCSCSGSWYNLTGRHWTNHFLSCKAGYRQTDSDLNPDPATDQLRDKE